MGKAKRRQYKSDLKRRRRWALLLFDNGEFRVGPVFSDEPEARDELLRWNRITGRDNHPVYAIGVMAHYPNRHGHFERRFAIRCMREVFAALQADRLLLAEALDRGRRTID